MEIGTTVTWREAVTKLKGDRRVVVGERVVTGTIIEHGLAKRGGKICKVAVSGVEGYGTEIVGQAIWRKRGKISKGRSWHRCRIKASRPNGAKRR